MLVVWLSFRLCTQVAYKVNEINQRNQGLQAGHEADPITKITETLNMQLTSLKWAEEKASFIQESIRDLQQRRTRLVQERSYG